MIEISNYTSNSRSLWDDFVTRSKNGTFLFYRDYMEYHADRFVDASLLFFEDDDLAAVMPANIVDTVVFSHGGLTFGGIISDRKMNLSLMLQLFEQLTAYLKAQGIGKIVYKAIPYIYHKIPAEEDLYALFRFNAHLVSRDASSTIFSASKLRFNRLRQRKIKLARKNGLVVRESSDFTTFMSIMKDLLHSRYDLSPTHTGDELNLLASRFPDNIKLFAAYKNEEMLAGVITYEHENVIHAQYNGFTEQGREVGAGHLVFDYLISEYSNEKKYFDFGKRY